MGSSIIILVVSGLLIAAGALWHRAAMAKFRASEKPSKRLKRGRRYSTWLIIFAAYVFLTTAIGLIFGKPPSRPLEVAIAPERVDLLGFSVSTTVIYTWGIMLVLIIAAIILRLTLVPRFKDVPNPKSLQNVLELAVETIQKYTKSSAHGVGDMLASYLFTVALFLIGCACTELFGLRTPASDITLTGALAVVTFFLINFYGIKVKGVGGRVKSLASPTWVVFPIKIITDLAVPVSLASRLFGNMLGGLVVMDLLYSALGGYAVGIPSVAGLYFNVFHPLIQAFIFITLTLTFINEATE